MKPTYTNSISIIVICITVLFIAGNSQGFFQTFGLVELASSWHPAKAVFVADNSQGLFQTFGFVGLASSWHPAKAVLRGLFAAQATLLLQRMFLKALAVTWHRAKAVMKR